jgi:hypothetical protein
VTASGRSARTDQISELGLQYGTKAGFYMIVGGAVPAGIAGLVRSSTDYAVTRSRVDVDQSRSNGGASWVDASILDVRGKNR